MVRSSPMKKLPSVMCLIGGGGVKAGAAGVLGRRAAAVAGAMLPASAPIGLAELHGQVAVAGDAVASRRRACPCGSRCPAPFPDG